jgi:hypothetical protein
LGVVLTPPREEFLDTKPHIKICEAAKVFKNYRAEEEV